MNNSIDSPWGKVEFDRKAFGNVIVWGVVAALVLLFVLDSYYTVDQGERAVVTVFGAVQGDSGPGLHFRIPLVNGITKISVQVQRVAFEKVTSGDYRMQAYSRDQQPATVALAVNYHVTDPDRIYSNFGDLNAFENRIIDSKTLEIFKNVFGQFDAADAIQQRAKLNAEVTLALQNSLKGQPAIVDSVQIEDISFSQQYESAVEQRMQAIVQQQQAEAEKQKRITNADAAAYEVKAAADAQAHQVQVMGDAQAHAVQVTGEALSRNPGVVALTTAQKWDGHLPTTFVPGSSVPFLDVTKAK